MNNVILDNLWDVREIPLHHYYNQFEQPKSKALYRNDNNKFLKTVEDHYPVVQNKTVLNNLLEVAETLDIINPEINFKEAYGGKRVIFQLKIPSWKIRGEEVARYLTTLNTFDKSGSLGVNYLSERLFCGNQWYSTYKDAIKLKHIGDIGKRFGDFFTNFENAYANNQLESELYEEMAETYFNPADVEEFTYKILGYDSEELKESTRKQNNWNTMNNSLITNMEEIGENKYGIFQGVTAYTNHEVNRKNQNTYLLFNSGRTLNDRALKLLAPNANKEELVLV